MCIFSFEFLPAFWLIEMIASLRILTLGFLHLEMLLGCRVAAVPLDIFSNPCSIRFRHVNLVGGC